jgi:putative chitinase
MLNAAQLSAATGAKYLTAAAWVGYLDAAMARFNIDTPARQAAFLAQVGHESGGLTCVRENLNYSADALLRTWPARFSRELAQQYGRTAEHPANQRMIAEIAYGGRMGNRPTGSGDAWQTIGRGPIQITGTDNYIRVGHALGVDFLGNPVLLERPDYGSMAAAWFWAAGNPTGRSLNVLADAGDVAAIRRAVNGGSIGLAECAALTAAGCRALGAVA